MRLHAIGSLGLVALMGGACEAAPPAPKLRELASGEIARVGDEHVDAASVQAIAAAQGTSLAVARDRAIRDALFAVEARTRGRALGAVESAWLARRLLDERRRELDVPVTDEELAEVSARHWLAFDRPEGFRVVHAIVLVPATKGQPADPATWERAESVASRVREAANVAAQEAKTLPANDNAVTAALNKVIAGLDAGGFKTKVEPLPGVAADGRVLRDNAGTFAPEFAAEVSKLRDRGDTTPPFRSPFGIHVAILLERTPAQTVAAEERRAFVHDEVLDQRVRAARAQMVAPHAASVEVATNVAALLDLVQMPGVSQGVAEGRP